MTKRKNAKPMVAAAGKDGEMEIISQAEYRRRQEEWEKTHRHDDIFVKFKKNGTVPATELFHYLASLKHAHEGEASISIPIELLDIIGLALVGRYRWYRNHGRKPAARRTEKAAKLDQELRKKAEEHWKRKPNASKAEVALHISRDRKFLGTKPNTIRRKI